MNNEFRFKITFQTIKDYWRTTLIITFLFMILTALYAGMFPSTEEALLEMKDSGLLEDLSQSAVREENVNNETFQRIASKISAQVRRGKDIVKKLNYDIWFITIPYYYNIISIFFSLNFL